ncbi:FKBP-type peptidyl-prolyl cis-trans isomerase [Larsenimonas rhizosphaerae]|uniref:Peptidyl-prolyl cis-trans isomerase n=1 Tax=Larsenimonas rhizosphaerae TaxID=2944682 RepID=A0AA42CX92_9GAMM|nr:peptidylprolyl isomerase [Larsenimonas rhizosphaerae]MCM2130908.1 peptidylprolyl isomerase [Larsenimonas rhizosphaerae]MCX2523613.1 peptidylprolyl isomerase [Larsenimonas rhizosphaerae]
MSLITSHHIVGFHYVLRDENGQVIDDSCQREKPLYYLHGHGNIMPALEEAMTGRTPGDRFELELSPAQAYGERNEALTQTVSRGAFGASELEPGMRFQANGPDGPRTVTVVSIDQDNVTVDANHPLAGRALNYSVEILDIRDATRAELAKGHPLEPGVSHSEVEDRKQ